MESQEYSGPILNKKQRFIKTLLLHGQLSGNEVTGHQGEYANKPQSKENWQYLCNVIFTMFEIELTLV